MPNTSPPKPLAPLAMPKPSQWAQVGGDINPGAHGGVIATCDGTHIEIREIQPVVTCVGEAEALEVGHPFWTREGYYSLADLDPAKPEVQAAMRSCDLDLAQVEPQHRAMALAQVCLQDGELASEGPAGWAEDVVPGKVRWWGSKRPRGWRYLAEDDQTYRALVRAAK